MNEDFDDIPDLIEINDHASKVIPVTILTGFLGSGSSSVILNYYYSQIILFTRKNYPSKSYPYI
jgi:hypothetical protein